MINRILSGNIQSAIKRKKIVHIQGPRQTGKTTLLKMLEPKLPRPLLWLNGDDFDVRAMLAQPTSTKLKSLIGKNKTLVIDEAQRIPDIGLCLKIIKDNIADITIIVTGSSAFELANRINEPLTGRKTELFLFPLSFEELVNHTDHLNERRLLEHRLVYGSYPDVVLSPGEEKQSLKDLSDAYLYKDLLAIGNIKKPEVIENLLKALALQLGNEISYNEISRLLGADKETVERYIRYLEQAYIVYKLESFSRNQRSEIRQGKKIYFYDNGIRNALIKNFTPLSLRQDTGALWENYMISERMKFLHYHDIWTNTYFWRTHSQQEIDYIEERDGSLFAFEIKWNPKKTPRLPKTFENNYPSVVFKSINPDNYPEFIYPQESV